MDLIKEKGHSVAEHLAEQPAVQVPDVFHPDPPHLVTVHQLAKGRIVPYLTRLRRALRSGQGS